MISKETRRHDEFRSSLRRRRRRIRGEANGSVNAVYIDIIVSFHEGFDVFVALYGRVARLLFSKTARAMNVSMELVRYYSVAPCVVHESCHVCLLVDRRVPDLQKQSPNEYLFRLLLPQETLFHCVTRNVY